MRRDHPSLISNPKFLEDFNGVAHRFPIACAAHHDAHSNRGVTRQSEQRFTIFFRGSGDDIGRQMRRRRLLIPRLTLQPVTHKLLIK